MKAAQDFVIYEGKEGHLVPYYSGDSLDGIKKISIKKGEEIPSKHLKDLVNHIPDYVELEYVNNDIVIPKELRKKPKKAKDEKKEKKGYTKEELDNMRFSKLKSMAKEMGHTGRSKSGLIKHILENQ